MKVQIQSKNKSFDSLSEGLLSYSHSAPTPSINNGIVTVDETGPSEKLEGKSKAIAVFFILGLGNLVSWNAILTIEDYLYILFPTYHPSRVLTLLYQPFALVTTAILAYNESKINTRTRNLTGYTLLFACAFSVLMLDLATLGKGGIGPYIGLCVLAACFGFADAHVQGGMVGELSFMCPEFIQSYFAGLAASGALTSILRLLTKAAFNNSYEGLRKGAMLFLVMVLLLVRYNVLFLAISTLLELVCVILYAIYFPKLSLVKYYHSKAALEGSKTVSADFTAAAIQIAENQQNVDYAAELFLIYTLTLSIFPGFLYENTGSHQSDTWYPVILITMFNVWDLIARYIPLLECLKLESRKGLLIATLLRFLLIPAFYFSAKNGEEGWMIMLTSFLGFTNGYLSVCILTVAPRGYKGPEQNALGNLLVLWLLSGLFAGSVLGWLWLIGKPQEF